MQQAMKDLSERIARNRVELEEINIDLLCIIKDASTASYTVAEIAEQLGVTRQTVYTYLRK